MESVMTVRLNGDMKERAAAIMRREGYTPSSAVRRMACPPANRCSMN